MINSIIKKFVLVFLILLLTLVTYYSTAFADAERTFKENSKAVVVVISYNEEGKIKLQGSGFIVRKDGAVVTNCHVITDAKNIKVKSGNKVFDVEGLIYTDIKNDLVILKAKGNNFPVVKLDDIEKIMWVEKSLS